jgi:hypothetical protein
VTKISFGIIALNAQPLLEYNLRALYPFAHQIIVVEGAVKAARSLATAEGHSTDGTLEMLRRFQAEQDPQHKLIVVSAQDAGHDSGFWPEKDEMSRAYAERATGDWLWQVDSDEFYRPSDMQAIVNLLERDPSITAVSFPYIEFFGSFDSQITGTWHLYEHSLFHRLFRWGKGYSYQTHRPPTVLDAAGNDLRKLHWIFRPENNSHPIFLYHYSYVFPKQAKQKVGYYANVVWTDVFRGNQLWLEESYLGLKRPMFLSEKGRTLQWLEPFRGQHPEAIQQLREDLASGKVAEPQRPSQDIERLLASPLYRLQRGLARLLLFVFWPLRTLWKSLRSKLIRPANQG